MEDYPEVGVAHLELLRRRHRRHVREYEGEIVCDHVARLLADLGGDKVHGRLAGRGELADVDGGEQDEVGHEVVHVLVHEGLFGRVQCCQVT